ncbi:hypothetical protein SAMN04488104_10145 [Algoriphagus faecimaris]|uniref:SpoIIAA-like n=1 Tax=Algoriphagus faecimaris TaxID=686796 RepID=A0A1G6RS99_9BACT|nr:hypothetical protein [Algoriphagus faecimaris]SDD07580.1 hypothetical protein SAMN04488104_10145 [Algoriphagus faecimaris]
MKSYAIIDESEFPLIHIRFTGNKSTDQNFRAYLDETKACYRSEKRLAIIFDASQASIPALSHQKMQAQWLKDNRDLMLKYCAGTAYVIPNPVIRAVLSMIFSFQNQPVPYQVVKSLEAARRWVDSLDLIEVKK